MVDTSEAKSSARSTSSSTSRGLKLQAPGSAWKVACREGAARVTVPMSPRAAVEASTVADMSELRRVCTASTSEPGCCDKARNQSSRRLACCARARRSGWRFCRKNKTASYSARTATVVATAVQVQEEFMVKPCEEGGE